MVVVAAVAAAEVDRDCRRPDSGKPVVGSLQRQRRLPPELRPSWFEQMVARPPARSLPTVAVVVVAVWLL